MAAATLPLSGIATDGTWISGGDSPLVASWDDDANWEDGIIADGIGATAHFPNLLGGSSVTVELDTSRTIGNLTFTGTTNPTATQNWTIAGPGTLHLQATVDDTPTITLDLQSRTAAISASISGNQGIQISRGANTTTTQSLTVSGSNSFSGVTTIGNLSLVLQHNNALGAGGAGNELVMESSTGAVILTDGITISGQTLQLLGQGPGNGGVGALHASGTAEWAGAIQLTGGSPLSNRIGTANSASQLTVSGAISSPGGSGLSITGQGTVVLSGANTYTGNTQIIRGTLMLDGGDNRLPTGSRLVLGQGSNENPRLEMNGFSQTVEGISSVTPAASRTITNSSSTESILTINTATDRSFDGVISGNISLVQEGSSTQTLIGTYSYTGATNINAGTLLIGAGTTISGSSAVNVADGATFDVSAEGHTVGSGRALNNNGTVIGNVIANGTVSGTGTIDGNLEILDGGVVSPGNSPGILTTSSATFGPDGEFQLELLNATGTPGTDWDLLNVTSGLNITATEGSPFVIRLFTLSDPTTFGPMNGFDQDEDYLWTFAQAGSLTGFNSNFFQIDDSEFQNPLNPLGTFSIVQDGETLQLQYLAIPEPNSAGVLLLGLGALLGWRRLRTPCRS